MGDVTNMIFVGMFRGLMAAPKVIEGVSEKCFKVTKLFQILIIFHKILQMAAPK